MKQVLLIAFHYPPFQGSSGVLRTLNFSKYLDTFGWQPLVLTAAPHAYGISGPPNPAGLQVPPNVKVWRAAAWDAARHLSIRGRYPRAFALPDRWSSWCLFAVARALRIVREYKPALIWSTYPIASAHIVGFLVHRLTGLPWIADLRDSMTEEGYPHDLSERRAYRWVERKTIENAAHVVFTTEGARRMYEQRYGATVATKFRVISNGYDEESFASAEQLLAQPSARTTKLTLLHSGVLYPIERDPRPFFDALSALKKEAVICAATLRVVLRASAHDNVIRPMIAERDLQDIVTLEPSVPYTAALEELMRADGLLLFQAANCNHQVPAKLYEYLRSRRPVLALTDQRGDTAAVLKRAGIDTIADLSSAAAIKEKLAEFLLMLARGTAPSADQTFARSFSRRSQAGELAKLFDRFM